MCSYEPQNLIEVLITAGSRILIGPILSVVCPKNPLVVSVFAADSPSYSFLAVVEPQSDQQKDNLDKLKVTKAWLKQMNPENTQSGAEYLQEQ